MAHLLIFTPITPGGLRPETVASIVGQQTSLTLVWEMGRCNPYSPPDVRNVLAQYERGRELFLAGPYDALLTVEQDMTLPPHTLQTLWDDGGDVVYGTYRLRHGMPVVNALQMNGAANIGMSLSLYDGAWAQAQKLKRMEVSGVGFGCTLLRRPVVEAIPFRADVGGHAPDMYFAADCLRQGIEQIARFDVRCGHIHEGVILQVESTEPEGGTTEPSPEETQTVPAEPEATVKVTVLQAVNILLNGDSVSLMEGEEIEVPAATAQMLVDAGYAKPVNGEAGVPKGRAKK